MNYITEINCFYDWLETNPVSDSAVVLWHALMHVNNKTGWKEEFAVAISTLELKTSLSKSSIIRARNTLKQVGRIEFRSREGQRSAIYRMNAFHTDTQTATQTDTQSGTQTGTQTVTIPKRKLNETKPNDSFSGAGAPVPQKKAQKDLPFWKEFIAIWDAEYCTRVGEKYEYLDQDFANLKKIYRKLEKRAAQKGVAWDLTSASGGLKAYINRGWEKDKWLRDNFSISNLLSQFNQIANGTGQTASNNGKTTAGTKVTGTQLHTAFAKRYSQGQ